MQDRSLRFALIVGVPLGILLLWLGGCSMGFQVQGIGLSGALDPGKLAPLFQEDARKRR